MNVNKVILVGRLTRDPEVKTTASGQSVTTVSIATNRFWKDKSGQKQEQTEYHNIVIWGRTAETAGQYLSKGQEAFFEGRMQTRSYTGKDGVERRITEVVAETVQFGSRPQGSSAPSQNQPPAPQQDSHQDAPADDIPTINLDEEKDEVKIEDVPF